jgi:hypothetical protein
MQIVCVLFIVTTSKLVCWLDYRFVGWAIGLLVGLSVAIFNIRNVEGYQRGNSKTYMKKDRQYNGKTKTDKIERMVNQKLHIQLFGWDLTTINETYPMSSVTQTFCNG